MGDSLQDQLRALGLARERQAKGDTSGSQDRGRAAGRKRSAGGNEEPSLDRAWALRERAERREAEQARQRKLAEERRRREINQALRGIVTAHRLNRDDADVARNFLDRNRIRKIYVTAEQHRALAERELGLVYLAGSYHLLAQQQVEAVRAISPEHVVDLDNERDDDRDFPVPDDLVW